MNYLATYNKKIKEARKEIYNGLNQSYNTVEIAYSRYPEIVDRFPIVMPFNSIKIKEAEKGTISFIFNIQDVEFQKKDRFYGEWRSIFRGLKKGFDSNQYLDIKEKFLTVTDEEGLNDFLEEIYNNSTLDGALGRKLIAIFRRTAMYKNMCDDCENLNKNYKKIAKNNNYEVEIFTLEFLNNGRIRMIYKVGEKEKKKLYDDFENLITFIISNSNWKYMSRETIKKECELIGKRSG